MGRHKKQETIEKEKITFQGFTPYSHQKAVIAEVKDGKGCGKIVTCKSSRQKGKSIMVENILLYYALNYPKTVSICLSPVLSQSRKIFKEITNAIAKSRIIKSSNGSLLEIELINGSQILFKSAEQKDSLRGYTVSGILCVDEAAFISTEVFNLCLAWTDVHNTPILLTSTPFVREGFFWEYYNRGLNDEKNKYISIDWCDPRFKEDIDKLLPPERLEEYRKILPNKQFRCEYLGEFLDADGSVFTNFKNCIEDNVTILPSDKFYVGIDWGNGDGGDYTVVTILNQNCKQVGLYTTNNISSTQQINNIVKYLTPFLGKIVCIQTELNSIGRPYTTLLQERLQKENIVGFTTTNQSKTDIVSQLQVAFENKYIRIMNNTEELKQLGMYMMDFNPRTKIITYNAPNGQHDDICMSLMFAYDAFLKGKRMGSYTISIL